MTEPVLMLSGRMLERVDAELLADLDRGLRQARDLISRLFDDEMVRERHGDDLELFLEDEGNQTELCWLWEPLDDE